MGERQYSCVDPSLKNPDSSKTGDRIRTPGKEGNGENPDKPDLCIHHPGSTDTKQANKNRWYGLSKRNDV